MALKKKKKATKKKKAVKKITVKKKTTARKKTKRAPSIKSHVKSTSLLSEALKDIEAELNRLRLEKGDTENQMGRLASTIEDTQEMEMELKNRVNKLILKEEQLTFRKTQLLEKITKVKKKIERVTQISAEMEEVG